MSLYLASIGSSENCVDLGRCLHANPWQSTGLGFLRPQPWRRSGCHVMHCRASMSVCSKLILNITQNLVNYSRKLPDSSAQRLPSRNEFEKHRVTHWSFVAVIKTIRLKDLCDFRYIFSPKKNEVFLSSQPFPLPPQIFYYDWKTSKYEEGGSQIAWMQLGE